MQGNKNRNRLGKLADYLITPYYYTLDLLPSPLFSVDILDSQTSAHNVSTGRCQSENSHMIQITSLRKSILLGEFWSNIYLKNKVQQNLSPEIEDHNMRLIYECDCDKFKLQFSRNAIIGCVLLKSLVAMDPNNSLEENIHKDTVGYGGLFMMIINSQREDHSENEGTILRISQKI